MNLPLLGVIFTIAFTVVNGVLMVILFVNQLDTIQTLFATLAVGTVLSVPISLMVAKKLSTISGTPKLDP